MTPPWGTVFAEHLTSSHPGFIPPDVLALLNSNERFWTALETGEIDGIRGFVSWYRAKLIEYNDAVDDERKAWAYYESLPLTHPNKSLAQANAHLMSVAREDTADELSKGTQAGVAYVRNLLRVVQLRGFTMDDLHDVIIRNGLGNRPGVTRGLRERHQIGDVLRGISDDIGGALRGRDPRSVTPGSTGASGPFDELIHSRFGGGIGGGPGGSSGLRGLLARHRGGGRVVSSAPGPGPSSPGGGGESGGWGDPSGRRDAHDFDVRENSRREKSANGNGHQYDEITLQGSGDLESDLRGIPSTTSTWDLPGNEGLQRLGDQMKHPDPTRDPSGLTGNPITDTMIMRQAIFEAGFVSAPQGPSRALRPDSDAGFGTPSQADIDAVVALDPLAPLVNPTGTDYEGRRHYPPRAMRAGRSRYIEALYPDGDPHADEAPVAVAEPHEPPGEAGDPHALVKSFTIGITSRSVDMMASRMSARTRPR